MKGKIKRAKAQLKLNLSTAIRDNKECYFKYNGKNRRAKENLYPLLDAEDHIATRAEEFNAFFASLHNTEINCFPGTQTSELEDRDEEQSEVPVTQGNGQQLVHPLDTHKSVELDGVFSGVCVSLFS